MPFANRFSNPPHPARDRVVRSTTFFTHYFSHIPVIHKNFPSAFTSMESNYATTPFVPQITWTTGSGVPFHVPGAFHTSGGVGITSHDAAIVPKQHGSNWRDSSLMAALGTIYFMLLVTAAHPLFQILLKPPTCKTPSLSLRLSSPAKSLVTCHATKPSMVHSCP